MDLESNINYGLQMLNDAPAEMVNDVTVRKQVQISDHLILEAATSVYNDGKAAKAGSYYRTVTGTLSLKNVVGAVIITLNANGKFLTDGSKSKPLDAYGSYNALVWNITNVNSSKGAAAYNAWVRVSFDCELNVGIDPVSMTIQSFSKSCTIYCNAKGNYSSSWS